MDKIELKKNQLYEAEITGYTSEGSGVCRINGTAVFVPGTVKGERWQVKLLKVNSGEAYARGEQLLEPSPARIEPDCPAYPKCGGCVLRHMRYEEELALKLQRVRDALVRIGGQTVPDGEILASAEVERYRNKGVYEFAQVDGEPVCGFYRQRSHDVIPLTSCLLQKSTADRAAAALLDFLKRNRIPPYDENAGKGTVRHLFCRSAVYTQDAVVCIVSANGFGAKTEALTAALRQACPELTGIVLNINRGRGNAVLAGDFYTLWGRDTIEDTLNGLRFTISPRAFYQINPRQAERLYQRAVEYAFDGPGGLALDLYCGAGTISLCLAQKAEKVIGAEIIPDAVENAKGNAERNGIRNAEFICGDAGQAAATLAERGTKPDVIVVDPPRKGISPETVAAISAIAPQRVVYVSCNPATLARDVKLLSAEGYALQKFTAVDMFPRTAHVETVVCLGRKQVSYGPRVSVNTSEPENDAGRKYSTKR